MIRLKNVSKRFKLYQAPSDRLAEWVGLGRRHQVFEVLRDINLDIPRGRTTGIVGANGAGKSTLLKLIAGTLLPTTGTIEIEGRVAALLELGTGFHPEFTGRQNIHVNGQLLGLTGEETARLEPEIIAFSELGPFIDQPIRTYSSGMVMRLGFSIAASVSPDVLIVDEALSVGDARFSQKCIRRIREFRDHGTTILFVSHDPGAVTTLCDDAILMENGEVRTRGLPRDVLDEYNAVLAAKGSGNVAMRITRTSVDGTLQRVRRHGTFQAVITRLELLREDGTPTDIFHPRDTMRVLIRAVFLTDVVDPSIGFMMKDRLGNGLFGTNTALRRGARIGPCKAGEYVDLEVRLPLRLGYGDYNITVAIHEDETHLEACYEWADNAAIFHVRHEAKPDWTGMLVLDPELVVTKGVTDGEEIEHSLAERFDGIEDPLLPAASEPSPFLSGFRQPDSDAHGPRRVMEPTALFAFRPATATLRLRVGTLGESLALPVEVEMRFPTRLKEPARSATLTEEVGTLEFELPHDMAGRMGLFELETKSSAPGPCLAFHRAESAPHTQEGTEWQDTSPAKLSRT